MNARRYRIEYGATVLNDLDSFPESQQTRFYR